MLIYQTHGYHHRLVIFEFTPTQVHVYLAMNANSSYSSTAPQSSPDRERPPSAGRLPSLDQLATCITTNPPSQMSHSSVSHPCLDASILLMGSQTSLSATTSVADSQSTPL